MARTFVSVVLLVAVAASLVEGVIKCKDGKVDTATVMPHAGKMMACAPHLSCKEKLGQCILKTLGGCDKAEKFLLGISGTDNMKKAVTEGCKKCKTACGKCKTSGDASTCKDFIACIEKIPGNLC